MFKVKILFEVLEMYKSINIYSIFYSLRLVNKLEFDSNLGKLGSSSVRQIFIQLELT